MRRVLKIVTAVVLLFTMLLSISLGSYAQAPDVKGHWAEVQINDWMEKGFVKGYSDGSFKPENAITRAEYFALVNRSLGFFKKSAITFKDVSKKDWFADDVSKAKAQGYLAGYQDNTAAPNKPISRQEMITILARILKLKPDEGGISKFSDAKSIAAWAKGSVGAVHKLGYINEYLDKSFKPDRNATRAEVVAILSKAIGTLYNSTGTYGPATGTKEVSGNVTISKTNVILKNTVINGNLYLTEGIGDGAVTLENVTIKGTTTVSGGGERSIVIINSSMGKVVVNIPDNAKVRLVAKGTTKIEYVEACSSSKFEEDSLTGTGFNEILVEIPEGASVELAGNFDKVDLKLPKTKISILSGSINVLTNNAKDAVITAGSSVTINTLTVNQPLKLTGSCIIGIANINSSNVTVEPKPKTVNIAPNLTGVNVTGVLPAVVTAAIQVPGTPSGGGDPGGGAPTVIKVTGFDPIADIAAAYGTTIGAITLPTSVVLRLSNGTTATENVVWDTSTYHENLTGTYTFPGTFALPTGVTNPDNLRASVRVVVGQQIITVTSVAALTDITVAYGTTISAITLPATVTLQLNNSTTATENVVWDTSSYIPTTAGTYTFSGTFALPAGVTNPSNIRASVRVVVEQQIITVTGIEALADISVAYGTTIGAISLPATVTLQLSNSTTAAAVADWDTSSYQSTTAGACILPGSFTLPLGVTNPSNISTSVRVIVQGIQLSIISVDVVAGKNVMTGTAIGTIGLPTSVPIHLSDGTTTTAGIIWNTSSYDENVLGLYILPGTLTMPEGVVNLNNTTVSVRINVVQPVSNPRLNTPIITSAPTVIDEFDGLTPLISSNNAILEVDTENKVSGTASLKVTSDIAVGGGEFVVERIMNTDLSGLDNLQFSFYTPDLSQINHVAIRIYNDERNYFSCYSGAWRLVNGWNRITQSDDYMASTGNPSWSNIAYIRVIFEANAGCRPSVNLDSITYNLHARPKVLFTFDDGSYDLIDNHITGNAYSYLTSKGFKATVWVKRTSSALPGSAHIMDPETHYPAYMNENDLDGLYNAGWDIGNHTVNHPDSMDGFTEAQIRNEYLINQQWLIDKHWTRGAYFAAYPSGVYNDRIIDIMRGIGILAARTTSYGLQSVPVDNMYKLRCIALNKTQGFPEIRNEIDNAIQTGSTVIFMMHKVENTDHLLAITTAQFQEIVDYVDLQWRANRLDVSTMSEWYNAYIGNAQPVVTVSGTAPIPDINVAYGTTMGSITLPAQVSVNLSDSSTVSLNVTWNTSSYSPTTAGRYTFTGVLALPAGITNPAGRTASISVVVGAQVVTVTGVNSIADIAVAYGTTIGAIGLPGNVVATLSNTTTASIGVIWNTATYNATAPGTYSFTGTLSMPAGITNPAGITASISVVVGAQAVTVTGVNSVADITVAYGTTIGAIVLPENVVATLSNTSTASIGVTWNTSAYSSTASGIQTFTGTLSMPAGITNPAGMTASVRVIVEEQVIRITAVEGIDDIKVPLGTTEVALLFLPNEVEVTLSNATVLSLVVTWETSTYDGSQSGTYSFTGILTLPEGITNPEDWEAFINVIVEAPEP